MPQENKKFSDWYPSVYNQAQRCPLEGYTPEQVAIDAITMQTSRSRLRKKALTEGPDYVTLVKLGCILETTDKQAADMKASKPM